MSDIIERVADAIDAARYRHPEHPRERDRPFSEADRGDREYATRLARAAIQATRDPTHAHTDEEAIIWRRMIDRALGGRTMQHDAHVWDYWIELVMRRYPIALAYLAKH